jgi:hypothetical protein
MGCTAVSGLHAPFATMPAQSIAPDTTSPTTGVRQAVPLRTAKQRRLSAMSRALAACFGAYGLTLAFTAALGLGLQHAAGWTRAEATMTATLPAFVIYLLAALRAFTTHSARRAWAELCFGTAVLAALAEHWR